MFEQPLPDGYQAAQPFWTKQQYECFMKLLPLREAGAFMEPRCGKSKVVVDKVCFYYERKSHPLHVNGLIVLAFPNGVHRGWITEAFPENCPRRIKWRGFVWRSDKEGQVGTKRALEELYGYKGLAVLTINAEAMGSLAVRTAIGKFIRSRGRVAVVFDESSALVNSGTLRSRVMFNIGALKPKHVIWTMILDGTPTDRKGPLDYWSQVGWMGNHLLGYANEVEYRNRYAEIKLQGRAPFWAKVRQLRDKLEPQFLTANLAKGMLPDEARTEARKLAQEVAERRAKGELLEEEKSGKVVKFKAKPGRDWWTVVAENSAGQPQWRNMDELWGKLDKFTYRATFAECFPNAKQHVYQPRYFQLTPLQRRVYAELQKEYKVLLDDGTLIRGEHPLTRQLRAQQITSNYYPDTKALEIHGACDGLGCDGCDHTGTIERDVPLRPIDPNCNPRMDALELELRYGKPTVVWCRFRPEVDAIMALAHKLGISACRYDGAVNHDQKADAREGFQAGKYDLIVGNETSLSRGVPLWRGEVMVAYSNQFSFRTRKQVEERTRHGAKTTGVAVVDIVAEDTVDDRSIIPALRKGMDVSTYVNRDPGQVWI